MNDTTSNDLRLISDITDRAFREITAFGGRRQRDFINLLLDIENFHRLCPLDLPMLADVDAETFQHDVIGIWNHYDRQNDIITGCFVPRTAACNHQQAAA